MYWIPPPPPQEKQKIEKCQIDLQAYYNIGKC